METIHMKWIAYAIASLVLLGCNSTPNLHSESLAKTDIASNSIHPKRKAPPHWFTHPETQGENGYSAVAIGESIDINTAKRIAELKLKANLAKYVYVRKSNSTYETFNVNVAGTLETKNEVQVEVLNGKPVYKWYVEGFISNEVILRERNRIGIIISDESQQGT